MLAGKEKRTGKLEEKPRAAFCAASISVIIPAHNEARHLPHLLRALKAMPEVREIIVSDGGSCDQTVQIARKMGAQVVEGARGRGPQQNLGAGIASGEVLWFVHADALPSRTCGRQITRAVRNGAIGGNFRLHFAARGVWPRIFETIARWRRSMGDYYGDTGIFATRAVWENLGGFREWPLFEDLDFARRIEALARRDGRKTRCLAGRLRASPRRFEKAPLKIFAWWIALQLGYDWGVSPHVLARFYRRYAK